MASADADHLGLTPGGGVDGPTNSALARNPRSRCRWRRDATPKRLALAPRSRWRRDGWRWRGVRVGAETVLRVTLTGAKPRQTQ